MTVTSTNNPDSTNNQDATNTNGKGKGKTRGPLTAIDAISKISKILEPLSPHDRKRVLTFIFTEAANELNEITEPNA